jgi:hypothetical protein
MTLTRMDMELQPSEFKLPRWQNHRIQDHTRPPRTSVGLSKWTRQNSWDSAITQSPAATLYPSNPAIHNHLWLQWSWPQKLHLS